MAAYTTKIVSENSDQNYYIKMEGLMIYYNKFTNIYNIIFIDLLTKYRCEV